MPVPPARRMTLRQLLTHTEKCSRDLIEHTHTSLMSSVADFRDLSRPVRRKSHFPTVLALMNSLNKFAATVKETEGLADYLYERLQDIREHANRERANRL